MNLNERFMKPNTKCVLSCVLTLHFFVLVVACRAPGGSPKAQGTGGTDYDRPERETEENEIIINYNRSLSPILEENEDECSLPPSVSVAHCSNIVESTIVR